MTSLECMTYIQSLTVMSNLNVSKLLVAVCLCRVKNMVSHNFKLQDVVSLCILLAT